MKIEKRLRFLASQNPNYAPLLAQWEFDKRLLSRALNTVSNNFPHYSLHDESHSSTIINQIEKVISPNIELLSATDCWLLLEACYWHDSGMIINHEEKKNLVSDPSFLSHLSEQSLGSGEFSKHALSILDGIEKGDVEKLLNDSQYLVFIIADYYRSQHAFRSEEHVNNPNKIGVDSPRTHLIPKRLISLLAEICSCHGKNPEDILFLPQASDGMDSEDYAHPRYTAALLRIGDLLDIDDGRFCETMLRNIPGLPRISIAHKKKHKSIKQLYIDSRVIEIKSQCDDYESFSVQQAWFDYIQSEFDYQKRVWNRIVPEQSYTALPTVNNISCEIIGYLTVNGSVPKVTLNKERIYRYLTGSLLYRHRTPFVRELIQNSIDAIHYKVWAKYFYDVNSEYYIKTGSTDRNRILFAEKLSSESICVNLRMDGESVNKHILSIKDSGMGMGLSDIEKIINVGAKNKGGKYNVVSSMPDWAKPSGFFGIGFQSVFDVSNKVTIETRQNGEAGYLLDFNRTDENMPNVGIKTINKKWFEGTNIEIHLNESNSGKISSSILNPTKRLFGRDLNEGYVDPLVRICFNDEERLSNLIAEMRHKIEMTFRNVGIKIKVGSENISNIEASDKTKDIWTVDYDIGVEFNFHISNDKSDSLSILYRGAIVEQDFMQGFLKGSLNIFSKSADEWLTINRDGIRTEKKNDIFVLLDQCVERNKETVFAASENKGVASLYLKTTYGFNSELWKDVLVNEVRLGDVLDNGAEVIFNRYRNDVDFIEDGSEPNPLSILQIFSKLAIKEGYFPRCEYIDGCDNPGDINNQYLKMTVAKEVNSSNGYVCKDILKDIIIGRRFYRHRRICAICYSDKFYEISLPIDEIPRGVQVVDTTIVVNYESAPWVRYVFLPYFNDGMVFEDEVKLILDYFVSIGKYVEKETASKLFNEYWGSLGVMSEE